MVQCAFNKDYKDGIVTWPFECPFEAEPGKEYCYWHEEKDGKTPDENKLEQLRNKQIFGVYLRFSIIVQGNFKGMKLQWANFEGALLPGANLQESNLLFANLKESNLSGANLEGAALEDADLQGAILSEAILLKADLHGANLRGANLGQANLKGTDLTGANLQGACLYHADFDANSILDQVNLIGANLYLSYIDQTKTLRSAKLFKTDNINEKEINEFIADNISKQKVLGAMEISHCDKKKSLDYLVIAELVRHGYEDLLENIKQNDDEKGNNVYDIKKKNDKLRIDDISHKFSSSEKKMYYERSYEVYNKLYNFYSADGNYLQTKHLHYRRGEAYRKLLHAMGGLRNKLRAILFDGIILKELTGYGDKISNPIIASFSIIILFAGFFKLSDSVIVTGRSIHWYDYLYLSLTTFTGLGFSNVQPNVQLITAYNSTLIGANVTVPWPQVLVMTESGLGVMMIALIIFTVTYQVAR